MHGGVGWERSVAGTFGRVFGAGFAEAILAGPVVRTGRPIALVCYAAVPGRRITLGFFADTVGRRTIRVNGATSRHVDVTRVVDTTVDRTRQFIGTIGLLRATTLDAVNNAGVARTTRTGRTRVVVGALGVGCATVLYRVKLAASVYASVGGAQVVVIAF